MIPLLPAPVSSLIVLTIVGILKCPWFQVSSILLTPQRCRGTTRVRSCRRSPTAGRARPTPIWSTALSSPTSAILVLSWSARRSSCASGISPGAAMCRGVRKVRGKHTKRKTWQFHVLRFTRLKFCREHIGFIWFRFSSWADSITSCNSHSLSANLDFVGYCFFSE